MSDQNKREDTKNSDFANFQITELSKSQYINPYRVSFYQNNCKRVWDGILAHPGVSCLLYNTDKQCIILVRQFRPVIFVNKLVERHASGTPYEELDWTRVHPNEGFTYELCAGLCDKNKTELETIKEEILEECGYEVGVESIHRIAQSRSPGIQGALHTTFYAEVDEGCKVRDGGGNADEGEFIEIYELPVTQIREFVEDESFEKPLGCSYSLKWFLYERDSLAKRSTI